MFLDIQKAEIFIIDRKTQFFKIRLNSLSFEQLKYLKLISIRNYMATLEKKKTSVQTDFCSKSAFSKKAATEIRMRFV